MSLARAGEKTISVYMPVAPAGKRQRALAQRLPTLDGAVVGLLDNTKDLADTLLQEVRRLLQKDFPTIEFRSFRKESINGVAPGLVEELSRCDAIVTGVGD